MADITNPHDRFFKEMLSQQGTAEDFLRYYLPSDIVPLLRLDSLGLLKDTFVDQELQEHFSDLLYDVKLTTGDKVYIYVLFEHKSYSDPMVGFQLLRYLVHIWDYSLRQGQSLRPILPVVVYHGAKQWHVSEVFHDFFDMPEEMRPFVPAYRYWLCDLSRYTDDEMRGGVLLQAALLAMKYISRPDLVDQLPSIFRLLRELSSQHSGLRHLEVFLRYITSAGERVNQAELREAVERVFLEEGGSMMSTLAERWLEQGLQQGLQQGLRQGLQEGQEHGLREGFLAGIELGLELRFGVKGLRLLPEIVRIEDAAVLRAIHEALKTVTTLDELQEVYR